MPRNTTRKAKADTPEDGPTDGHPERVSVDVAEPFAVFWDGQQRGGTLHNVPWSLAQDWLRQGWAHAVHW